MNCDEPKGFAILEFKMQKDLACDELCARIRDKALATQLRM
jgi:hypothetical protein